MIHELMDLEELLKNYERSLNSESLILVLEKLISLKLYEEAEQVIRTSEIEMRGNDISGGVTDHIRAYRPGWSWVWDTQGGSDRKSLRYQALGWFIVMLTFYSVFALSKDKNSKDSLDNMSPMNLLHRNKVEMTKNVNTKFSEVQGINEFRQELEDLVDFLKNSKKYTEAGAYIPKGVLLVGPPGTGKTLLAKAIAGEAQCSFFYKSASEFEEVYVGVGAQRIRELFEKARQNKPAIIFIDEIDALSLRRESIDASTRRQTINQLLTEMDGFNPLDSVIVIGATNMPEKIDKAVLRPGRFDKIINIPYPDQAGRAEIFKLYLDKVKYDKNDVHLDTLVKATTGFSGASIKNLVNIAVLNAIKEKRKEANHLDFEHALDRVTMGVGRKSLVVSDKEKLMTAYHEGGHTLVNLLTKSSMPLHKVTILPRGAALGFTAMLPDQDAYYFNKTEILTQIQIALGGRVAEEIVYGNEDVTTGCSSDMNKATDLAYQLLREYGMDSSFLISRQKEDLSEKYNAKIDAEAQRLVREALQATRKMLQDNRLLLDVLAKELVKKETLSKQDVLNLLRL